MRAPTRSGGACLHPDTQVHYPKATRPISVQRKLSRDCALNRWLYRPTRNVPSNALFPGSCATVVGPGCRPKLPKIEPGLTWRAAGQAFHEIQVNSHSSVSSRLTRTGITAVAWRMRESGG